MMPLSDGTAREAAASSPNTQLSYSTRGAWQTLAIWQPISCHTRLFHRQRARAFTLPRLCTASAVRERSSLAS